MTTSAETQTTLSMPELRTAIHGRVIAPGDTDYDTARVVMLGGIDKHPAVIVRVADSADVATVIGLARRTGLELAIRSGGHSGAGHSTTEGGIVLDLRDLTTLDVDVEGRTAWVGSGLSAVQVCTALAPTGSPSGSGTPGPWVSAGSPWVAASATSSGRSA